MNTRPLCILLLVGGVMVAGCGAPYYSGSTRPPARQSIILYDNAGNRTAYGTVTEGGYIQLFSPSGERLQWGRVK